ncbi:MAG: sulfur carrier protein ThiS [Desulfovibrio sp.]|uniref:sulfur carrier protein ThiS n=1 Tax=Desulfovibrio sp. TaxID=885 RepID=UPI0039E5CB5A
MNIVVNGLAESCAPETSISAFLAERGYEASAVVVERNGQILARDTFAQTCLQKDDCLEIVQFVGGG